ncbi:MAG: Gram-negative bacterial TonB protein C-terminal [Alphaproteobacteria bacterium]|nr:Gram-negative bacterial TonB protein C-terminal [Alphaproteobacteria bacterium]
MLAKTFALIAALAPTAAAAHCCCEHRHHHEARADWGYHRTGRAESWDGAWFEPTAGRPCNNYPRSALHAQASGVTVIRMRLDEDGFVEASRVSESSGRADLDRAARACVAGWQLGGGSEWRVARIVWRYHWVSYYG